ncbi:MAG: V-type ATP synthase subunit I, partial [Treponema sp.]|nr:V-type ATP synthase subunit I [Treponema sp.]
TDKKNNVVRLVAFGDIPNRMPYPMPDVALSVVEERKVFQQAEMSKIEEELAALNILKKNLLDEKKSVLADMEFEIARSGMEHIEGVINADKAGGRVTDLSVSWISGFVPAPDLGMLKRAASESNWALYATDPEQGDTEVPTKLKNGKVASLIYPVTDFLELIPGYWETDISLWFLIFFTLFFAMIFGDAAYGAILLVISLIGIIKTSKKGVLAGFKLLLLLSIANVVWGTLVCSWFGLDTARVPQFLQNLSLPLIVQVSGAQGWLDSYNASDFWIRSGLISAQSTVESMRKTTDMDLMLFCFTVALVQLGIAHIRNAVYHIRSLKVLSEIGRLGMVLGMYFVILSLVVFNTGFGGVQPWQLYSLAGGFVLVFLFENYKGNLLKSIITSCSNLITVLLNITNVFSDIMSYIRLWAVGLAAASISGMINGFADPMFSHLTFFVLGLLFFAFGHGFNMVLNVLAVLIHGIRLNTLEFSSHIGLTWSGFAYKPFAKRQ